MARAVLPVLFSGAAEPSSAGVLVAAAGEPLRLGIGVGSSVRAWDEFLSVFLSALRCGRGVLVPAGERGVARKAQRASSSGTDGPLRGAFPFLVRRAPIRGR